MERNSFYSFLNMATPNKEMSKCDVEAPQECDTVEEIAEQGSSHFSEYCFNCWSIIPHSKDGIYPLHLPRAYDNVAISAYWDVKDPLIGTLGFLRIIFTSGDDKLTMIVPSQMRRGYSVPCNGMMDYDISFENFTSGTVIIDFVFSNFNMGISNVVRIDPESLPIWVTQYPPSRRASFASVYSASTDSAKHESGDWFATIKDANGQYYRYDIPDGVQRSMRKTARQNLFIHQWTQQGYNYYDVKSASAYICGQRDCDACQRCELPVAVIDKYFPAQHEGGPWIRRYDSPSGRSMIIQEVPGEVMRMRRLAWRNRRIHELVQRGFPYCKAYNQATVDANAMAFAESGAASVVPTENAITDSQMEIPASNVVLTETQGESTDAAAEPFKPSWYLLSTTEACHTFPSLTDRWLAYKTITWKTTDKVGTLMMYDIMPLNYLNFRGNTYCNCPNFINFNVHAYWRGDLEFKFHINSNQFQSGMLVMSWLYSADSFQDYTLQNTRYSSIGSIIQQPHIKSSAGTSNEATLLVPYNAVVPFLRTKNLYSNSVGSKIALNMGRLCLTPLVELRTGTSGDSPQACDVTIFIKFNSSQFTGMFDGSVAKPSPTPVTFFMANHESSVARIIKNGVGIVDKVIGDLNADDPPATRPPQFLVPMNAQSWSHGTNTYEPTYTLRLDGGRIGVGRSADIGYSDTGISGIVGVYGLLKPITWNSADKKQNQRGTLLWTMGVHPQCDKEKMFSMATPGLLDSYAVPPCGVISSMFCYWRGSLNFKFDVVCNSKHTGRLIVAYIPGFSDATGNGPSFEQATSSSYIEFSLNTGTNSFTFTVPYIAETMWWPRKYGGPQRAADFIAPSTIAMFVLNQLVPMESVSREVTILPFVCAGIDFEVSVPAQPAIGLALNRVNSIPDKNKVQFKSGYFPVYVGEWRNFQAGNYCIMRYGEVSDHVAQLTTPSKPPAGKAYYYSIDNVDGFNTYITEWPGGQHFGRTVAKLPRQAYTVGYGVIYQLDGYYYMIPFPITNTPENPGENAAQLVAIAAAKGQWDSVKDILPKFVTNSDYVTQNNIVWTPHAVDIPANAESGPGTVTREETPNVLQPTRFLPSTNSGIVTYGEAFKDLKDLCRRYQLYYEGTISPVDIRANKRNAAFLQIPVLPQGLDLDPSIENPVWNNMREGHIPIVSSGFRFYRGGIRFRIVITGLEDSVWVQHHPDRYCESRVPVVGRNITGKDAYRNHSYGFHVQNLSVNRTIEIEVPYYKPGLYGLLGDISGDFSSKAYASIGDVVIGLEGDKPVSDPIDVAVYYCLADDCSFNKFCGFPMMVFCDEVFREEVPPVATRILRAHPESKRKGRRIPRSAFSSDSDWSELDTSPARHEMMAFASSAVSSVFGNLAGTVAVKGTNAIAAPVVRVVKEEVREHIKPLIKDIEGTVTVAAQDIAQALGRTLPQQAIVTALGQFAQVAMNPTPASIGVAVTTMISNFIVVSMELVLALQEALTSFLNQIWNKYFSASNNLQAEQRRANHEGFIDEMNEKALNGFLGMIFTAVASTVGVSCVGPSKFPNVMRGVKEALNVCNASVVFFKNIVDSVVYMYKYCLGATSEELRAKIIIEREYPHMKSWCDEVMQLLDPRNQNMILHSTKQANRIFDACIYGSKLINENLDKSMPGGKVVYDLYTKLCKLRDDLVELGNHPDIRFEAFPLWCCGPAGVGKSYMTQQICKELLQHIDYHTSECMIYWLALGQKYWNGVKNPPVIARDEAYAVGGQFTEEEIATHLAICSSSILNPPMAALQEKNKRLNPLIYYMNSNLEFPQINEARHPEAIYRRRKLMFKVDYTDEIKMRYANILDASELPPNEKENMSHLKFMIARDPKDPRTSWAGPYTYLQFIDIAKERFSQHVSQERVNFRNRMAAAYSLDPEYNPADQLNYVHGTTLSIETLHEQYIRERNEARRILFQPPPTIQEDSYLQSILDRFSYLWEVPVMPEMDMRDQPSTSAGMFTREARQNATLLSDATGLSRAASLKLVSGISLTDSELAEMVIDRTFSDLVRSGRLKMGGAVLSKYISMLPDPIIVFVKSCGWNDWNSSGAHFVRTYLPHWTSVEGTSAIRSYLYWKMREMQMRTFCRMLLQTSTKQEILAGFYGPMKEHIGNQLFDQLVSLAEEGQVMEFLARLDNANVSVANDMVFLFAMLKCVNVIAESDEFCRHCQFWVTHLHDTSKLEYNAKYNTVLYVNSLGLITKFDEFCTCSGMSRNIIFLNGMRIVWNVDHGTIENDVLNPFVAAEYRNQHTEVNSWIVKIWEYVKNWWRAVAMPFISTVLTFIYEHFGQIIMLLLGMYSVYNLATRTHKEYTDWRMRINRCKKHQDEATWHKDFRRFVRELCGLDGTPPDTFTDTSGTVWFRMNYHCMECEPYLCPGCTPEHFWPAFCESAGYSKVGGVPKAAKSAMSPANREGFTTEALERRLNGNVCFLAVRGLMPDENGTPLYLEKIHRCLAIGDRRVLIIRHYVEEILESPEGSKFMLHYKLHGKVATAFIPRETFQNHVKYFKSTETGVDLGNLGVLTLPKYVPMFKNILSSICTQKGHAYVGRSGTLYKAETDGPDEHYYNIPIDQREKLWIAGDDTISERVIDVVYMYGIHGPGTCGSILIADNVCQGNAGIIGIHVAGHSRVGYAEPIYREMFEDPEIKPTVNYLIPCTEDIIDKEVELDTNLIMYGVVSNKYSHHESGKTKIVPSLVHGKVYDVLTEPNPLCPNDPRQPPGSDPLRDGCVKHGQGWSIPFPLDIVEDVSHDQRQILLNRVKNPLGSLRTLTVQETVCGTVSIPFCEALNWKSSEGFPLSSLRPKDAHNKRYLFDLLETSDGYFLNGMDTTLSKLMAQRYKARVSNINIPPIYIDCLKDYRLPPEKCAIPGKTRIFSIAPIQVTLDVRKYMGLFLSGYRAATVFSQHGIGINPDSPQWTMLADYLLEVGDNIVTGDYSNFGPTLSSQLVSAVFDDVVEWHRINGASEEHLYHLQWILENEIMNPLHLCKNLVYQTINGIPSGSPITAELNSEVNKYYIKCAFLLIVRRLCLPYNLEDFNIKCRLVTYGDDFIMSVHNDFIDWFNCQTISDILKEYGVLLTDVEKNKKITPYRRLGNSSFLKRMFKRHPKRQGFFLAPIETQSITECINWCHKQTDLAAATAEVIRASCVLAYSHGPVFYKEHVERVRKESVKQGIELSLPSWKDMDEINFGANTPERKITIDLSTLALELAQVACPAH